MYERCLEYQILEVYYIIHIWLIITLSFCQMATTTEVIPEQLNLKVKSQDGEEIFFKIKSTTQMKKLMDAYCQRQGLASGNVRFLFDGERIHQAQTPKELNMENGDEIDAVIEQTGGSQTQQISH